VISSDFCRDAQDASTVIGERGSYTNACPGAEEDQGGEAAGVKEAPERGCVAWHVYFFYNL